jgi:hypothetical protein
MNAETARDASQGLIQVNLQLDKNFPKMSEFASIPEHEDANQTGSDDFRFSNDEFGTFFSHNIIL